MAITKTITLSEVRVINASSTSPILLVTEEIMIDDPDDNQLPITSKNRRSIPEFTENQNGELVATDVTSESSLVQNICSVVWPPADRS